MSIVDWLRRGINKVINAEQNQFVSDEFTAMYKYMRMWDAYYQNKAESLLYYAHNDEVYKNATVTYPAMYRVSNKVATLIFTELPRFAFDKNSQDRMEHIIEKNQLFEKLREAQTEVCGLGNAYLKINVDKDKDYPVIEVVRALDAAPHYVDWGVITEGTFYALKAKEGNAYWWLAQTYTEKDGKKVIESKLYKGDSVNLGKEHPLTDLEETADIAPSEDLKTEAPWFVHVKSPMPNNKDPRSPLGMSIAANSLEQIDHINLTMQSYYKDDKLKQPKAAVTEDLVTTRKRGGKLEHSVDFDEEFYIVLNSGQNGDSLYKTIDMKSKQKDFEESLQGKLDRFYESCGLFRSAIKKEGGAGAKTATEWELADKDSVDTAADFKNCWLVALKTLFRSLLEIDNVYFTGSDVNHRVKHDIKQSITIEFMDGIKNDQEERSQRALLEYNTDLIDEVEYFMVTRKLTEDEATELVKKMRERSPKVVDEEF